MKHPHCAKRDESVIAAVAIKETEADSTIMYLQLLETASILSGETGLDVEVDFESLGERMIGSVEIKTRHGLAPPHVQARHVDRLQAALLSHSAASDEEEDEDSQ